MSTIIARAKAKIKEEPVSGCWLWTGMTNRKGYGCIRADGGASTNAVVMAHRLMYEDRKGKIPDGLVLDHLCRNHACVNPWHLEPVTHKINSERGLGGVNNRQKTHCKNGHPYSAENTRHKKDGSRVCKTCYRLIRKRCIDKTRVRVGRRMGEAHPQAKLTAELVLKIRSAVGSDANVGKQFGVSAGTISRIRLRKIWKHLP